MLPINEASLIQAGTAIAKLPLAIIANQYNLTDNQKKYLIFDTAYRATSIADVILKKIAKRGSSENFISPIEVAFAAYDFVEIFQNIQKLKALPKQEIKENEDKTEYLSTNEQINLHKEQIKKTILTILKYTVLTGDTISSAMFPLATNTPAMELSSFNSSFFKILNLLIDNKRNIIFAKPLAAALALAIPVFTANKIEEIKSYIEDENYVEIEGGYRIEVEDEYRESLNRRREMLRNNAPRNQIENQVTEISPEQLLKDLGKPMDEKCYGCLNEFKDIKQFENKIVVKLKCNHLYCEECLNGQKNYREQRRREIPLELNPYMPIEELIELTHEHNLVHQPLTCGICRSPLNENLNTKRFKLIFNN